MRELHARDYHTVAPLFDAYRHHRPILGSAFEGRKPARILVDDHEPPTAALLSIPGVWSYFAGRSPEAGFVGEAAGSLFSLVPTELEEVCIFCPDDAHRALLDVLLAERKAIRIYRKTYRFDVEGFTGGGLAGQAIPAGTVVERFADGEAGDFGVRLVRGQTTVSECKSVFTGYGHAEISVSTEESERGKGLATWASAAFIADCLKKGLVPCWGCWPYNQASDRLAAKLSFVATEDLPAHFWAPDM